jgi:hypothetical protein
MARARNIKPGFYKNEDLAECSIWARFIFPGLWMLADREGRLEDRPKRIKGELIPFDSQDVEPLLKELSARGFILRYEIDGQRFIQILKFKEHQTPHYSEKKSVINPPPLQESDATSRQANSKKVGVIKTTPQPPDSLNPDSLNPESPFSDSPNPDSKPLAVGSATPTAAVWTAYSDAYRQRHGVEPVRNAKVNGQLSQFVTRIPKDEAPRVAAFYVASNRALYVNSKHCVDLLLRDAESLRTEWATGRQGTETEGRQADRTQATGNAFAPLIAEARRSSAGK